MAEEQKVEQGKRLKAMRKFLRISQAELAQTLSVTQSFLSLIESGKGALSRNVLTNISNYYTEINTNWLLNGTGEMLIKYRNKTTASQANEQQLDYENASEEMDDLNRRVRYIEEFMAKKFVDFDPEER